MRTQLLRADRNGDGTIDFLEFVMMGADLTVREVFSGYSCHFLCHLLFTPFQFFLPVGSDIFFAVWTQDFTFPDEAAASNKPTPTLQVNSPPLVAGAYDIQLEPGKTLPTTETTGLLWFDSISAISFRFVSSCFVSLRYVIVSFTATSFRFMVFSGDLVYAYDSETSKEEWKGTLVLIDAERRSEPGNTPPAIACPYFHLNFRLCHLPYCTGVSEQVKEVESFGGVAALIVLSDGVTVGSLGIDVKIPVVFISKKNANTIRYEFHNTALFSSPRSPILTLTYTHARTLTLTLTHSHSLSQQRRTCCCQQETRRCQPQWRSKANTTG